MEKPPAYLLWFFLRSRKHGGENGYLVKRFADMDMERMLLEVVMLDELLKLHYILLADKTEEKVFNPLVYSPRPGVTVHRVGTESRVPYPPSFEVAPAGHYALRELFIESVWKGIGTVATAAVGILIGLLLAS